MNGLNRDRHLPLEVVTTLFDTIFFLFKSPPSEMPSIRDPTYSRTPTLTVKLYAVKRARYGRVFLVLAIRINVLFPELSTGLSLYYLKTGSDGSLDRHIPETSCLWKWA